MVEEAYAAPKEEEEDDEGQGSLNLTAMQVVSQIKPHFDNAHFFRIIYILQTIIRTGGQYHPVGTR